jgi:hypothetical protein
MGRAARSAPLELLDTFGRKSLGTESGKLSIPRRNLALEKDATHPYTALRALHREIFAISTKWVTLSPNNRRPSNGGVDMNGSG